MNTLSRNPKNFQNPNKLIFFFKKKLRLKILSYIYIFLDITLSNGYIMIFSHKTRHDNEMCAKPNYEGFEGAQSGVGP